MSKQMKTLTLRGTRYEIVDDQARRDIANIDTANKRDCVAPIVQIVEGSSIAVADSSYRPIRNLRMLGKTSQATEPSLDNPQELETAENPTITIKGGNLIPVNYADGKSKTMNGVTFEVLPDGSVIVNGTATATAYFSFNTTGNKITMPNGWLSTSSGIGCGSGIPHVQNDIYVDGQYINAVQTATESATRRQFFGKVELGASRVKVDAGVTVVSQRIYPMLCAFENPIDYEPPKQEQNITINRSFLGIPVSKNGNYTDVNGQQWICDEIDFDRGIYVQRVGVTRFDGLSWAQNSSGKYFCADARGIYDNTYAPICTHVAGGLPSDGNESNVIFINANNDIRLNLELNNDTVEAVAAAMKDAILHGVLIVPIETALTEEELTAFNELYTHKASTTIQNDNDVMMEVEYSADIEIWVKKYISDTTEEIEDERIANAIEEYLEENPVSGNASARIVNGVLVIS